MMKFRQIIPTPMALASAVCSCIVFLLCACGGGGDGSSGNSSSDGGSISFRLDWVNPGPQRVFAKSPSGNVCVDYLIDTVSVNVQHASAADITVSWDCDIPGRTGTIDKVPAGTDYSLTVDGVVAGSADWRGQVTGIAVDANQDTNVGTVVMNYFGADSIAPTVSTIYPGSDSTDILRNTAITVTFSEYVVPASVNAASHSIVESGTTNAVPFTITYDAASYRSALAPSSPLKQDTGYTVTVTTDIEDLAGLHMESNYSWSFTTGAATGDYLIWDTLNWDENFWN
jgi:hypothetical protein